MLHPARRSRLRRRQMFAARTTVLRPLSYTRRLRKLACCVQALASRAPPVTGSTAGPTSSHDSGGKRDPARGRAATNLRRRGADAQKESLDRPAARMVLERRGAVDAMSWLGTTARVRVARRPVRWSRAGWSKAATRLGQVTSRRPFTSATASSVDAGYPSRNPAICLLAATLMETAVGADRSLGSRGVE
jgi:hypothetical protein